MINKNKGECRMFNEEYGEAAVEVLDILDNTKKEDVNKIPKES